MVNQQVEEQSPRDLPPDPDGLDDFRIVDNTSADQLEVEQELDAELNQQPEAPEADVDGERVPLGRDTEREVQPAPQAQVLEEPEDEPEPEVQQPQTRNYSQDEVSKMQASWMRQIREEQEARRRAEEARDLEAQVETRLRRQEESLRGQYGEDEARRMVRTTENEAIIRDEVRLRQENQRLQQQLKDRDQLDEQQAKTVIAQQVMRVYGLETGDYELLLQTSTPTGMQALAQRLSTQTLEQRRQEQARKARVPAETPRTQLENGRSTGTGAENAIQRLNRLRAVPSYEWSEADTEFMRTGRM